MFKNIKNNTHNRMIVRKNIFLHIRKYRKDGNKGFFYRTGVAPI